MNEKDERYNYTGLGEYFGLRCLHEVMVNQYLKDKGREPNYFCVQHVQVYLNGNPSYYKITKLKGD